MGAIYDGVINLYTRNDPNQIYAGELRCVASEDCRHVRPRQCEWELNNAGDISLVGCGLDGRNHLGQLDIGGGSVFMLQCQRLRSLGHDEIVVDPSNGACDGCLRLQ